MASEQSTEELISGSLPEHWDEVYIAENSPSRVCGYTVLYEEQELLPGDFTCIRPTWGVFNRCFWHTNQEEKSEREIRSHLKKTDKRLDGSILRKSSLDRDIDFSETVLNGADLYGIQLDGGDFTVAELESANLQDAHLLGTDISRANCWRADFSGTSLTLIDAKHTYLSEADISDTTIFKSDFSGAIMNEVRTTGAQFWSSDFSDIEMNEATLDKTSWNGSTVIGADFQNSTGSQFTAAISNFKDSDFRGVTLDSSSFREVDLSDSDLRNADFTGVELATTLLSGVRLNRGSVFGTQNQLEDTAEGQKDWDTVARVYHQIKSEFNNNGLIDRARYFHIQERRARENEVKATDGSFSPTHLGSLLSRYLTGYGVSVRRISLVMLSLFVFSTVWYEYAGISNSVYYSMMTFTTAAPPTSPPDGLFTQMLTMVETFFGTLLIVLLGYVLGNREQV